MNTSEKLNAVVNYIEKHITEKTDTEQLAKIAGCSVYDVNRMFMLVADISIAEYIRRRRMTLAGYEIRNNNLKISDAAVKYGYDSPISFTRAFYSFHGIKPSEARNKGVTLKSFGKLIFIISTRQASKRYGKEKITVNGKEYTATFLCEKNWSYSPKGYSKGEYLRLENAYDDFKNCPRVFSLLYVYDIPTEVKTGQMFVIDYFRISDGGIDRKYYIADGTVNNGIPAVMEIDVKKLTVPKEEKMTIAGKEYSAFYLGERDLSAWSEYYSRREFRLVENAYNDFKNKTKIKSMLPYNNYPYANIKQGQVFAVDYFKKDGTSERKYYIADGSMYLGMNATIEFIPDDGKGSTLK